MSIWKDVLNNSSGNAPKEKVSDKAKIEISYKTAKEILGILDYYSEIGVFREPYKVLAKQLREDIKASTETGYLETKIAAFWDKWENAGIGLDSGYTVPEMFYFAIREGELGTELWIDIKANVWGNEGKFTYPDGFRGLYNHLQFATEEECVDGIYYYNDVDADEVRKHMLKAGFEENKAMIKGLK